MPKVQSAFLAAACALAASAARAETITIDCEIVWTTSESVGGQEPIISRVLDLSRFTLDLNGKTAVNEYELNDGSKGTAIRPLLLATPQKAVMCQGEKCQEPIFVQGGKVQLGLTTIDLVTMTLTRNRLEVVDVYVDRKNLVRDKNALGSCRKV